MKFFIATLLLIGCASFTLAAPPNAAGEHPATTIGLMQVLQNHDIFQTILTHLVGGLKDALKYNHPHQFVPVLQKSIQQLAEVLPYIRFAPLIRADHGISKEAQDLINALTASPSNGVAAMVNAFVDKRIYDMHSIHGSYKFIQSKLEGLEKPEFLF